MSRSPWTAREAVALLKPGDQVKLDRAVETGTVATGVDFTEVFSRVVLGAGGTKLKDSHKQAATAVALQVRDRPLAEGHSAYGYGVRDVTLARHGGDAYRLYFGGRGKYVYVVEFATDGES